MEGPDTHMQDTVSILSSVYSGREVTYPFLGKWATSLNNSWSGKTELGIQQYTVPFHFICPGGTYRPNSLTPSPGSYPWRQGSWPHSLWTTAASWASLVTEPSPPSLSLLAWDLYLTHAKEPRLSRQMTHRCYWIAVKTLCTNEQHDT